MTHDTMTVHDSRALEAAREVENGQRCATTGRQGDVVLRRLGDADPALAGEATPRHGIIVAAGLHGEHRLIADAYGRTADGHVVLHRIGVLVHTDVPEGRHGALILAPGTWEVSRLQELSVEGSVKKVED